MINGLGQLKGSLLNRFARMGAIDLRLHYVGVPVRRDRQDPTLPRIGQEGNDLCALAVANLPKDPAGCSRVRPRSPRLGS
jgi:hypothetical protein